MIGIYKITNILNGDCYIGKSNDIKRRWQQHRTNYNNENLKCYNLHLYRAFRKYGIDNFLFEVIELCQENELIERETFYYEYFKPKYCMVSPKQDILNYDREKHKQSCMEAWNNKSEENKIKTLNNLKLGVGGRFDKKGVVAININDGTETEFESLMKASEILNIPRSSISQILNENHKRKQSKGYTFKYK